MAEKTTAKQAHERVRSAGIRADRARGPMVTAVPAPPRAPDGAGPELEAPTGTKIKVRRAVRLGWQVVELRNLDRVRQFEADSTRHANGDSWLPVVHVQNVNTELRLRLLRALSDARAVCGDQVPATLTRLVDLVTVSPKHLASSVPRLHMELLEILASAEVEVRHGYELGVRLAQLVLLCRFEDSVSYDEVFQPGMAQPTTIQALSSAIADLRSCLPDYAGTAVQRTLETWQHWYAEVRRDGGAARHRRQSLHSAEVDRALYRHGEVWLALLSGEKRAQDLLTIQSYMEAVSGVLAQTARTALQFLRHPAGMILSVIFLGLLGFSMWLLADGRAQDVTPALVTMLGSLGITTATVATAVKNAMSRLEMSLWDAELDSSIALAAQRLPVSTRSAERLQKDARKDTHRSAYA